MLPHRKKSVINYHASRIQRLESLSLSLSLSLAMNKNPFVAVPNGGEIFLKSYFDGKVYLILSSTSSKGRLREKRDEYPSPKQKILISEISTCHVRIRWIRCFLPFFFSLREAKLKILEIFLETIFTRRIFATRRRGTSIGKDRFRKWPSSLLHRLGGNRFLGYSTFVFSYHGV